MVGASDCGFSLIETLVATTIMTVALAALSQFFLLSTRATQSAKTTTLVAVLAAQKMEQLRGLAFGFDLAGLPLTDTTSDLTSVPERAGGGPGLSPSPPGSLEQNVDGYCDFLDARGRSLEGGNAPPPSTVYIRRWSIAPLPTSPAHALVFGVLVTPSHSRGQTAVPPGRRLPDEARIVDVKTRKAG